MKEKLLTGLIAFVLITSTSFASPIVDGSISGDGYLNSYSINFSGHEGRLSTYQIKNASDVWGDLFVAFTLPSTFVDNTFGENTIGSYHGNGNPHTLKQLIGSDNVELGIGGNELKLKYEASTQSKYYSTDFWKELKTSDAQGVENYATSLQWNYSQYNTDVDPYFNLSTNKKPKPEGDSPAANLDTDGNYVITDSGAPDWIFDVIYEFQYSGLGDKEFTIDMFRFLDVHASPSKTGDNSLPPNDPPPNPIPEPTTMLLFSFGLLGLVGISRKQNK